MGVLDRIRAWRERRQEKKTTKRLNQLEADLNMLYAEKGVYVFNPKYYNQPRSMTPEQEFTLSVLENFAWFSGKPYMIRQFYQSYGPVLTHDMNYFWAQAPANYRKVHSGLPALIANKMGIVLFGGGILPEITIYKLDADGKPTKDIDEPKTKAAKDILEVLMNNTAFAEQMHKAAVTASWCGHVFIKLGYDMAVSDYPIIEIADIRNAELVKDRGITTEIIFKNYYKVGSSNYVHKEIYTTNEQGEALVIHKLYRVSDRGDEKEVPLTTLPETAPLAETPELHFSDLKGMLAFELPNKLPNNEFPDSPYGASDYAGAHSSYDALDEVLSEMYSEVRNNKPMRYVPDTMLRFLQDEKGSIDIKMLDPFVQNYIRVSGDPDQNAKNEIVVAEIKDKQESLKQKWVTALTTALNIAGLSPYSIGITGIESVDASAESQQERNKTTLETRSAKLKLWVPLLEKLLLQFLALNSWMQKNLPNFKQEDIPNIDIDFTNCRINVKFGDYVIEKQGDKINTWGTAKQYRVSSTREAVKNIHPDWTDSQIDEEVNLIRFEEGMALDSPDNLPNLTGYDEEEEPEDKNESVDVEKQKTGQQEQDMTKMIEAQQKEPKQE